MNQVTESFIKTVNFSCPSAFNQGEFVAPLEEEENDYGEIIYHANLRCLFKKSSFICWMRSHHSWKERENYWKLNEEWWIRDREFLVCLTVLLCNLIKELKVKVKLITEVYDNKKASNFKLQLCKNRLKVHIHTRNLLKLFILSAYKNMHSLFFCFI